MTIDLHPQPTAALPIRRLRSLLVIGPLTAFGPLSMDAYLPGLPALGHDLGGSPSATQATLTGCLVGLALGQLLVGPISDAVGRRRPLLIGIAIYVLVSVLCAIAPSIWLLVLLRIVQGLAAAAGIVIGRAVVRDFYGGVEAAQFFGLLMLVTTLAPILAPVLGAQILRVGSWRSIFFALAAVGVAIFALAAKALPETLPPERRRSGGAAVLPGIFGRLLQDRSFLGYALAAGLLSSSMFSYIAGAPFALQEVYGLSPQGFSLVFALNAFGVMLFGQLTHRLVGRFGSRRLLIAGLVTGACGGASLLACVLAGIGLAGVLPSLFLTVAAIGLVLPNASALALTEHPEIAGSASALLGVSQFALGAAVAPLAGANGAHTAVPMAVLMSALTAAALVQFLALTRERRVR